MADFDPEVLRRERARNSRPAYGLTLVAGYPLPDYILTGIDRLRQVCRRILGDRVELYSNAHLHFTVYSLLRSRTSPLSGEELAAVWSYWLPRVEGIAEGLSSLTVPLRGLSVTHSGTVLVCGAATDSLRHLQWRVNCLPGGASLRDIPPHITIGHMRRPCGNSKAFREAMTLLHRHAADLVGTLRVTQLCLLYYSSRLLDQVLRSVVIPLYRRS